MTSVIALVCVATLVDVVILSLLNVLVSLPKLGRTSPSAKNYSVRIGGLGAVISDPEGVADGHITTARCSYLFETCALAGPIR